MGCGAKPQPPTVLPTQLLAGFKRAYVQGKALHLRGRNERAPKLSMTRAQETLAPPLASQK